MGADMLFGERKAFVASRAGRGVTGTLCSFEVARSIDLRHEVSVYSEVYSADPNAGGIALGTVFFFSFGSGFELEGWGEYAHSIDADGIAPRHIHRHSVNEGADNAFDFSHSEGCSVGDLLGETSQFDLILDHHLGEGCAFAIASDIDHLLHHVFCHLVQ